jgi:hypothetical protein
METYVLSDGAIRQREFMTRRAGLGYKQRKTWLSPKQLKLLYQLQQHTAFSQQDTMAFAIENTAKSILKLPIEIHNPSRKQYHFKLFGWEIILRKK